MITVYPPYTIGEKIGHVLEIEATTVGELLNKLKDQYRQEFVEATSGGAILINGIEHYRLKGNNTQLTDGDYVAFINPVSSK